MNKTGNTINVVVNGSGTIGRAIIVEIIMNPSKGINLIAVNDKMPIEEASELLEHNFWKRCRQDYTVNISNDKKKIFIKTPSGQEFSFLYFEYNGILPWNKIDTKIDIVFESSGAYSTREELQEHINHGVGSVLLSRRSKTAYDVDKTIVFGINHNDITKNDKIISAASCTTSASIYLINFMDKMIDFELCQTLSCHVPLNRKTNYDDGPGRSIRYASHFGVK
jgi:glyceraldehyde-3-phosphate dehydrogenase/erythrose-4-phosphate dehydrogenase